MVYERNYTRYMIDTRQYTVNAALPYCINLPPTFSFKPKNFALVFCLARKTNLCWKTISPIIREHVARLIRFTRGRDLPHSYPLVGRLGNDGVPPTVS